MTFSMDSAESPVNYHKIVKITNIDHVGGPSENCQKNVFGRLRIVKRLSTYCPRTCFYYFLTKYRPKEERRPKAAALLLGAAGGRDHIIVKK